MKRNQQSLKQARRAKTRPQWEAQQRAKRIELERIARQVATPFNEGLAELARGYIRHATNR